ncbi:MAG: leucine-rich repeat domain-containing protein, partial [Muribaculaceae bacterium]|nr:leucine-rich repeat domain-containing protein [Muribaculaceae bacterium]
IGDLAFCDCGELTEVYGSDIEAWCKIAFGTSSSNPLSYAHHLFLNGEEVEGLVIPNSLTKIGNYTFYGCSSLTSVEIPNSVTSIGNDVFNGCSGLTSVKIGNSVTTIGDHAFSGCIGLTSVDIPNSVTSIGNYAFGDCSGLTNIIIEDGETPLSLGYNVDRSYADGQGLFYDCPIETLYLGRDLSYQIDQRYGYSPFYGIKSLKEVTIGNSVSRIGPYAFQNCSGLKSVHISDMAAWCNIKFSNKYSNPLAYAHHLFLNGEEVIDLVIPNSVTSIGNYAFEGCNGLYSVFIPYSVTSIGDYAFYACQSISEVIIEDGEISLKLGYNNYVDTGTGEGLFYDCPLKTLYIGRNLSYKAHYQYGYSPFVRRYISYLKDVTIGSSVTSVGAYAFRNCSLSSLTIKDGSEILNFDRDSFEGCSIQSLYLGRNVSPSQCFSGNSTLTSLAFGNFIKSIEDGAFKNCSGLASVVLPMGLTSVNESAFENCSALTSVTIPGGVRYIRSGAFKGCSSLESVNMINPIPAVIEEDSFDFQGTLNVPAESKMYYWIHPLWSKFPELEAWNVGSDVDFAENSVTYHITSEENATVEITAATLMARSVGDLTIPEAIRFNDKMYTVTGIANNAFRDMMFESVELPQTIAYVGLNAFSGCTALRSLTVNALMPPSVARESFDDTVFASATLFMPEVSREEYENDPVWGLFVSKDIAVGLDDLDAMNDGEIEVYDLKGVKIADGLKGLPKGIYIVRRGSQVSKIAI